LSETRDPSWADTARTTAFPIEPAGYPFILAAGFTTLVFALLELRFPALLLLGVTFFICYFFRDPERVIPKGGNVVVSPADGKVIAVETLEGHPLYESGCIKISIFMTIFDVHVNRVPVDGTVRTIRYTPGKFSAADKKLASTRNEQNAVIIDTDTGKPVGVVQVAGLVARRIICRLRPGDVIRRGQRYGLICFGSRLDVFLPLDAAVDVAVGQRVTAGASVLGRLS